MPVRLGNQGVGLFVADDLLRFPIPEDAAAHFPGNVHQVANVCRVLAHLGGRLQLCAIADILQEDRRMANLVKVRAGSADTATKKSGRLSFAQATARFS
jgi:hypothetical protein